MSRHEDFPVQITEDGMNNAEVKNHGLGFSLGVNLLPGNNRTKVDETSTVNVTYIGIAERGTRDDAAGWLVIKIDESDGTDITTAKGKWTDRIEGLEYA